MKKLLTALTVALLAASACGPASKVAPDFDAGTNQTADSGVDYPAVTGVGIGSAIPNYQFLGFPRANVDRTVLVNMQLADFYNPTGTGVYPEGSPYGAGTAKPIALAIDRAAVWCGPCNQEAKADLPGLHQSYFPKGDFLLVLSESATPGDPATQNNLAAWSAKYTVDYPGVLDPNAFISNIVGIDAYPGNVIVRTKDMKIVTWVAGEPDATYWKTFEDTMNGLPVLPGDPAAP
jgi:hypothetical protein